MGMFSVNLDWLLQSGNVKATPADYKRAPREDIISFFIFKKHVFVCV